MTVSAAKNELAMPSIDKFVLKIRWAIPSKRSDYYIDCESTGTGASRLCWTCTAWPQTRGCHIGPVCGARRFACPLALMSTAVAEREVSDYSSMFHQR
jgi:hypothetical protein